MGAILSFCFDVVCSACFSRMTFGRLMGPPQCLEAGAIGPINGFFPSIFCASYLFFLLFFLNFCLMLKLV